MRGVKDNKLKHLNNEDIFYGIIMYEDIINDFDKDDKKVFINDLIIAKMHQQGYNEIKDKVLKTKRREEIANLYFRDKF